MLRGKFVVEGGIILLLSITHVRESVFTFWARVMLMDYFLNQEWLCECKKRLQVLSVVSVAKKIDRYGGRDHTRIQTTCCDILSAYPEANATQMKQGRKNLKFLLAGYVFPQQNYVYVVCYAALIFNLNKNFPE